MFLVASLAAAGIPPLSGFGGKLLLVQGGLEAGSHLLAGISLATSLVVLYTLVRLFMRAFWGEAPASLPIPAEEARVSRAHTACAAALCLLVVLMGLGSEWMVQASAEAARTLVSPSDYIDAVWKE